MKFKVLKEFIAEGDQHFKAGETYDGRETYHVNEFLYRNGFVEKEEPEPWKPEEGKTDYYIVPDGGEGCCLNMAKYELPHALRRNAIGNSFPTREERNKAVEWLKAFKVLRDDTKGFKPDWKDLKTSKYFVLYDSGIDELRVGSVVNIYGWTIYFATEAEANESIKAHGKEWRIFLSLGEDA